MAQPHGFDLPLRNPTPSNVDGLDSAPSAGVVSKSLVPGNVRDRTCVTISHFCTAARENHRGGVPGDVAVFHFVDRKLYVLQLVDTRALPARVGRFYVGEALAEKAHQVLFRIDGDFARSTLLPLARSCCYSVGSNNYLHFTGADHFPVQSAAGMDAADDRGVSMAGAIAQREWLRFICCDDSREAGDHRGRQ